MISELQSLHNISDQLNMDIHDLLVTDTSQLSEIEKEKIELKTDIAWIKLEIIGHEIDLLKTKKEKKKEIIRDRIDLRRERQMNKEENLKQLEKKTEPKPGQSLNSFIYLFIISQ